MPTIEPCRDDQQVRDYIDANWRKGHILARDKKMFDFTYKTSWVSREEFRVLGDMFQPHGTSIIGLYDDDRDGELVGFVGAIVAPYPRPRSHWLALWHILPSIKGQGWGGKLLQRMEQIALADWEGWIGTFGAGPEALPIYLKRGYAVRAARRWTFNPDDAEHPPDPIPPDSPLGLSHAGAWSEYMDKDWLQYRYEKHPIFNYQAASGGVFRTEINDWGVVTHCVYLSWSGWWDAVNGAWKLGRATASDYDKPYVLDAWAFEWPGFGWTLAPEDSPSVFHPVEKRESLVYAVGRPFVPVRIHKGDCDQDRPN